MRQRHHFSKAVNSVKPGFTRVELLVCVGIIVVLLSILFPALQSARAAARLTQSKQNLRNIGLGLKSYHGDFNCFPPGGTFDADGQGFHGWLKALMGHIDDGGYRTVDRNQPWDSTINSGQSITSILCFQIPGELAHAGSWEFGLTHYSANAHLLSANSSVKLSDINNSSQTFIVGELAGDFLPWACPYNFRPLKNLNNQPPTYGRYTKDGALFLFVDGHVDFISNRMFLDVHNSLSGPDLAEFANMPDTIVRPKTYPVPADALCPESFQLARQHRYAKGLINKSGQFVSLTMAGRTSKDGGAEAEEADCFSIVQHRELQHLTLVGKFTDRVLPELRKLSKLENLTLESDGISEAGLSFVDDLSQLKHLDIRGKLISKQVRQRLRERLPNCEIRPIDIYIRY